MAKHIYQDPVTKQKFSYDKRAERSNPENNVRLIYIGDEGTKDADQGLDVLTVSRLTDLIVKAESSSQLQSILNMEIPKALLADREAEKALANLAQDRMKILIEKEQGKEQEEKEKFQKRQQIIADDITKKLYAAQSRNDLKQVYTPGIAVEGLSSSFATTLNQLYQKRWDELGGGAA